MVVLMDTRPMFVAYHDYIRPVVSTIAVVLALFVLIDDIEALFTALLVLVMLLIAYALIIWTLVLTFAVAFLFFSLCMRGSWRPWRSSLGS